MDGTLILHDGSACFAALTAIFAKVGVEHVGSDFATFIRTIVILLILGAVLTATQEWQSFGSVSPRSHELETRRQREGGV
jgi:transporter family protein